LYSESESRDCGHARCIVHKQDNHFYSKNLRFFRPGTQEEKPDVEFCSISIIGVAEELISKDIEPMHVSDKICDALVIGAGAAGLMCAAEAGKRGRSVVVLEHNSREGEKIRISGGGRCNFTNLQASPANYLSQNPHFCKSALARFTVQDFIALIDQAGIQYHERNHGQLFCDGSAEQIIEMLVRKCRGSSVAIVKDCTIQTIAHSSMGDHPFLLRTSHGEYSAQSLVIATGGLSIPMLGASPFGLRIAEQFGLAIVPPRPGLVPLVFNGKDAESFRMLSGISLEAIVRCGKQEFRESILFTHKGLSGPAILQVSSFWRSGEEIVINVLPDLDAVNMLSQRRDTRKELSTVLEEYLPSRFVKQWLERRGGSLAMNMISSDRLESIARELQAWTIVPAGTEGYRKAEVMVGGIDTKELSSKTMEVKSVPGLYFIGEIVDVTGWLGGFNFQWAWSSGWAAGNAGV
jgi:predicted Rossmann fold flavoprotein